MYGARSVTGIFFSMVAVEVQPNNGMSRQAGAFNADISCIRIETEFLQNNSHP